MTTLVFNNHFKNFWHQIQFLDAFWDNFKPFLNQRCHKVRFIDKFRVSRRLYSQLPTYFKIWFLNIKVTNLNVVSINFSFLVPASDIQAYTMTLPSPYLTVVFNFFASRYVFGIRHTFAPSEPKTFNLDSLADIAVFQKAEFLFKCSLSTFAQVFIFEHLKSCSRGTPNCVRVATLFQHSLYFVANFRSR